MSSRRPAPITPEALREQCRLPGCTVPEAALQPLAIYLELLMQWNKAMNLVGARHWREALRNLVGDSFHLAAFLETLPLPPHPCTWDLGAGAGLPGIPLRMVWQRGDYTLIELREKRALFLSTALAHLRLPDTTAFRGRAEEYFARAPRQADMIVSRAFLPWAEVLALVEAHIIPGGMTIFLMLTPPPDALPEGWSVAAAHSYATDGGQRWFWALRREAAPATPMAEPKE